LYVDIAEEGSVISLQELERLAREQEQIEPEVPAMT